jgi:hypothetical protein
MGTDKCFAVSAVRKIYIAVLCISLPSQTLFVDLTFFPFRAQTKLFQNWNYRPIVFGYQAS